MCRNPACPNFGLHYDGPGFASGKSVSDERYQIELKSGKFKCQFCGLNFTLKSNQSIRPLARYFLKLSLPFADCPNTDCQRHGVNLFEHWYPQKRLRPYRSQNVRRAKCKSCGTSFNTGEALQLRRKRAIKKELHEVILGVVHSKHEVSSGIERTRLSTSSYYSRLSCGGARLRDWHSWRNAELLHPKFQQRQEPLEVYTDTFKVSLQKPGIAKRYQYLNLITSVVKLEDSYFILAVHPELLARGVLPKFDDPIARIGQAALPGGMGLPSVLIREQGIRECRQVDQVASRCGPKGIFSETRLCGNGPFLGCPQDAVSLSEASPLHGWIKISIPSSRSACLQTIFAVSVWKSHSFSTRVRTARLPAYTESRRNRQTAPGTTCRPDSMKKWNPGQRRAVTVRTIAGSWPKRLGRHSKERIPSTVSGLGSNTHRKLINTRTHVACGSLGTRTRNTKKTVENSYGKPIWTRSTPPRLLLALV